MNRKCHCESLKHLYFSARQKKKFFVAHCGDESILIIPNAKSHGWTLVNQQHLVNIYTKAKYGHKAMLCIWWNMQGVYYELFKPNGSITGDRYQLQLNHPNEALLKKRPVVDAKLCFCTTTLDYILQKPSRKH